MAAYAWTPCALTWLHVNNLINRLHKQISWKNCLYADNLYFTQPVEQKEVGTQADMFLAVSLPK